MKRIVKMMALCVLAGLVLAACGSGSGGGSKAAATASPISLKIGHTGNQKSKYQVGMEAFKAEIQSKSGGRFTGEIFPMTLGGDRELLEGLQIGTVDFAEVNTSVIASIVEELGVIDLPFIFTSVDQANRVLDGKFGDAMINLVNDKAKVKAVAWWENGFRCFTNNKRPIAKPDDLKGLVMRTMQSSIHLDTFKLLGANPTPMSFSEMLTAMQQGVIDGHDNNPDVIVTNSMWEFQKYFSESLHFYGAKMLIFSNKFWNARTDSDREMLKKAAFLARDVERKECLARFDSSIDLMAQKGMNVVRNKNFDTAAFIKSVQPVWDAFRAKYGAALIDQITKG